MPPYRSRRSRTRAAQWIAIAVVAALAVLVIVLALLALDRGRGDEADASTAPVPSFTPHETSTPSPTPTPEETPDAVGPVDRADERFLAVGADGVVWRAVAGSCADGIQPLIERSTDGGQSWNDVTPLYREVRQVASLVPIAGSQAEIVAAIGDECEVDLLRTFTQGEFWEPYPDELASASYIDPATAATVIIAGEPVDAPCPEARSLATQGGAIALVCDGEVATWTGDAWESAGTTSAVAVTLLDSAPVAAVAAVAAEECEGLELADAAGTACLDGTDPAAPTALAPSGTTTWLWNGDSLTGG
ncbi:hypothetical protein M4I32_12625 [Microbacterium sp. LRZ72]|uniref:hypothetical protein n=1 Tax=Microbacterium sp. LRZ72 TaxID=2942481 RepID=UPI0029AE7101|nr:hypothetical protein [Microbacterium sp. LRZ72]MDX2377646.1 hypothetical protein [Microbacterium sp. LRZ72]